MGYQHAAVWIDHHEARVFRIEPTSFEAVVLEAPTHHLHKHPRGAAERTEHPDDAKRFFRDVTHALEQADEVLIVGPSTAKLHLIKYVSKTVPALEPRIVGVETVDHPTDREFAAYARKYFESTDRARTSAT
jgi:stalled ribosome rescue protein Dom34